ncbi:MAG: M23 family metallopeptidase [Actinomycetota bacterium]|nr:M23 family metallopeptidase [Actinomycetota bacterium]
MRIPPPYRLVVLLILVIGVCVALPLPSAAAGDWSAPLPQPITVTRGFDPPDHPFGEGHRGVDLAGRPGQEVRAAGAGTVVFAGPLAGRGVISVEHTAGLRTTYEPLSVTVSAGETVGLGQVIGTLTAGHAGCPVAACLHWGLKRGEHYLNPLLLLSAGPVRLLPRYGASRPAISLDPALAAGPVAVGSLAVGVSLLPVRARLQRFRRADGLGGRRP